MNPKRLFRALCLVISIQAYQCNPVEYEYFYEDDPEDISSPSTPAAPSRTPSATTSQTKSKETNYDIEDLVKAWKEYLKDKKSAGSSSESVEPVRSARPRPKKKEQVPFQEEEDFQYEAEEPQYECEPRSESYRTHDPKQCDKYYECNIKGEESEKLCPDGLVFDIYTQNCDYPSKVDCTERPELQPAQPSTNCSRSNGFFALPAEDSCQKFWDCRGGKAYLQICPEGVIFDPKIDACVTPDLSARPECAAGKFLGFECPTYTEDEPLKFGNHDRLPDPHDCVQFFSCLRSGQPRLGKCPKKTVFNPAMGLCGDPKAVPGCENYWTDKEKEKGTDYQDYYE